MFNVKFCWKRINNESEGLTSWYIFKGVLVGYPYNSLEPYTTFFLKLAKGLGLSTHH